MIWPVFNAIIFAHHVRSLVSFASDDKKEEETAEESWFDSRQFEQWEMSILSVHLLNSFSLHSNIYQPEKVNNIWIP